MYTEELIAISHGIGSKAGLEDHLLAEADHLTPGQVDGEAGQARGCLGRWCPLVSRLNFYQAAVGNAGADRYQGSIADEGSDTDDYGRSHQLSHVNAG
jgi:hypothetical protein